MFSLRDRARCVLLTVRCVSPAAGRVVHGSLGTVIGDECPVVNAVVNTAIPPRVISFRLRSR